MNLTKRQETILRQFTKEVKSSFVFQSLSNYSNGFVCISYNNFLEDNTADSRFNSLLKLVREKIKNPLEEFKTFPDFENIEYTVRRKKFTLERFLIKDMYLYYDSKKLKHIIEFVNPTSISFYEDCLLVYNNKKNISGLLMGVRYNEE